MSDAQLAIELPTCVLPGCRAFVTRAGQPCSDCVEAFGSMLRQVQGAPTLTATAVAARDDAIRAALRRQHATVPREAAEPQRKACQICWLCEERHTCTRTPSGWECDRCRSGEGPC